MAVTNPAYCMQGRTDHPAQLFRMALAGVGTSPVGAGGTAAGGGVSPYFGGALGVTGSASLSLTVGTGLVYIPSSTAWNGLYAAYATSTTTVTIPAASSTQWRRDYIVAEITDPSDNTAAWNIIDVEGTFSSSAPGALPTLPANCVPLAVVAVTPNMTVTTGAVTDVRTYVPLGGPTPCTAATAPTGPDGTMWYETDTDLLGVWQNGAKAYILTGPGATDTWHDYRPANSGFNGTNSGSYPPQYRKAVDGQHVELIGGVGLPASGMNGTNIFANAMPSSYRPNMHQPIPAVCSNGETCTFNIQANGMIQLGGFTGSGSGVIAYMSGQYALDSSGLIQT